MAWIEITHSQWDRLLSVIWAMIERLQIKCGEMFERCFVGIKDKYRIWEIS
jgi:hypothetical protein